LYGWRPYEWQWIDRAADLKPDVGPLEVRVPSSVQQCLLDAGIIPDWNVGLNSRQCEWVEHRHWEFSTAIPAGAFADGEPIVLHAAGLDYAGWIGVDHVPVAQFEGMAVPHRVDLTDKFSDGQEHRLAIVFDMPPAEQGQFGFTAKSKFFKSRYNYGWDWCPRIVPVGVWDGLAFLTGLDAALEIRSIQAFLEDDLATASVKASVAFEPAVAGSAVVREIRATVYDGAKSIGSAYAILQPGETALHIDGLQVEPWWPNRFGGQKLYTVTIEATDGQGTTQWTAAPTRVGFRRIVWRAAEGASADAEPWICEVNGKAVFLQGANWVPPTAVYHDTPAEDYRALIDLYRDMGVTMLRVWGGAILERETFYDLCDEAGILVWQEFPLSSSGIDNTPPRDPEAIARLVDIASWYIRRRGHHASLLLWSGGNELITSESRPVGYDHPCIAALRDLVARQDPGRRFIPTSPSGPRPWGNAEENGLLVHHDVHGPWGFGGLADLDAWRAYWESDDALFRSEVGMPGTADLALLERYAGGEALWPPTTPYWLHTAPWWTQWDRYRKTLGDVTPNEALLEYIRRTQEVQAEAYAMAARCCKQRFPRCGGFIIWMGHDCYPCPVNNSVIDFDRRPKPAYFALKKVFSEYAE